MTKQKKRPPERQLRTVKGCNENQLRDDNITNHRICQERGILKCAE